MQTIVRNALDDARVALETLCRDETSQASIADAGRLLAETFRSGGRAFSCGNGGSMCDAMHFAEELSGRFRKDRRGLPAVAMSDPGYLTCAGNDFGYDRVFGRFLEAQGQPGDVLLAISTSGTSPNVLQAAEHARESGIKVIALTGRADAKLGKLADIHIPTPTGLPFSDRVQELHIKVIHILIELCERQLFPEHYSE